VTAELVQKMSPEMPLHASDEAQSQAGKSSTYFPDNALIFYTVVHCVLDIMMNVVFSD